MSEDNKLVIFGYSNNDNTCPEIEILKLANKLHGHTLDI